MTNNEAKIMLKMMVGFLIVADPKNGASTVIEKYSEAVDLACEAIDLMDGQIKIENGDDDL